MTDYKETGLGAVYTAPNGDEFFIVMTKKGSLNSEPIPIALNFKNNSDSDAWRDILRKLQGNRNTLPETITMPALTLPISPFRKDNNFYTAGELTAQQMNDLKKLIIKSKNTADENSTLGV